MSDFSVDIVKIDDVFDHPNADKLSIVKIAGFNCISGKLEDGSHRYNKGDLVAYIPEAAVLPDWILQKLDFWKDGKGTLSGSAGNRVKAIKLRGVVSQGILYPVRSGDHIPTGHALIEKADTVDESGFKTTNLDLVKDDSNVAQLLGIIKYEVPVPVSMQGKVGSLFGYTKSYDIDNLQKYQNVFVEGENVVITEKLHGTLCQVGFLTNLPDDKRDDVVEVEKDKIYAYVTSKGLAGKGLIQKATDDNKDNVYVKVMNEQFLTNPKLLAAVITSLEETKYSTNIYVFGEIFGKGVQDLHYGTNGPEFQVFDVYVRVHTDANKGFFLNALELTNFCIAAGLKQVPKLYTGPFSMKVAEEMRDGNTIAGNDMHIREGVVIRPFVEREVLGLPDNRAQLKFINPEYLTRKGGTEFN